MRTPRSPRSSRRAARILLGGLTAAVLGAGLATAPLAAAPTPDLVADYQDPGQPVETRVADLLARMSLDDKIGQMTQAERASVTPADLTSYRLGSVLSGGGSAPTPNTPASWADMYDRFQDGALATPLGVPMIYGVDAVHGHNNVVGATIFPHNIGLGATGDPDLVERIGRATAAEMRGTGIPWNFAPCLCVVRNDRWGRGYESFGEDPALPSAMTSVITGMQGSSLADPASVLATAKHYLGDGGTRDGVDQGDTVLSEAELRRVHLPPFRAAVDRGVGSIMVSYNSWNGVKLHGHRYLITDVLKTELGFDGFVVSDWNGIDQIDGVPGLSATDVRQAVNAGIDMAMVPTEWRRFIDLLRAEVQAGRVTTGRVDDAVRRILTRKFELGLFERPYADRSYLDTVGSAGHRALAREAVAASQVLLKNDGGILPLDPADNRIFVAGRNADDIGHQSGGWTISWQGGSGAVTPGTSILAGIRAAVDPSSTVTYSTSGAGIDGSYRVAVAVVGETPYAEGAGDRPGAIGLSGTDRATIDRLRAAGVPVVVVLVSGRPLDIAAELPDWPALLASWLPGTEGQGVADVLFGARPPTGRLPVSWMASAGQQPINDGDGQEPLFPYGFGLTYPDQPDPTPTPTTGPDPTPTPTTGPTGCRVGWTTTDWNTGFTATVAVTNTTTTPVDGWTLRFAFPAGQQVTQAWAARVTQSGAQVSAVNETWNGRLAPGATVSFGFNGSHQGVNPPPTEFTLNGGRCAVD